MQSDKKMQEEHYSNIGREIIIRYWIQSIIQSEWQNEAEQDQNWMRKQSDLASK